MAMEKNYYKMNNILSSYFYIGDKLHQYIIIYKETLN